MPIVTGRRLGPYEVVAALGAGGMGEVYRARDTRLGRDVAVKVLPAEFAQNPDRLRRFEQEARAVAALDHPHILAIHDAGSEDGMSYVVFELLEGQTLREKLWKGAIPYRKCVEWGVQVCRGLAAAHARGIIHRDLKPDNLCLTADGRIKILDFGLAKVTGPPEGAGAEDSETRTATDAGFIIGTAGYMSPEQVRGQPADARSDIFSLGTVLYEMLAGQCPFRAATPADTISAILHHDPPEIVSGSGPVPAGLDRVVRRCLEKDPEERFQTARDLAFALENQSGASSSGVRPGEAPPLRTSWRKGVAASLLLLAVGAGAYVWGSRRPPRLPDFKQLTFRRGMILEARFTADGNSIAYSGLFDGNPGEVDSMRLDRPESLRLDLPAARLVGLSSSGELAIVQTRSDHRGFPSLGTLARVPLSGGAPREVLSDVWWADWSPDGRDLAVVRVVDEQAQLEYPLGHVLLRPFRVNEAAFALRVSPRGDRLAFSDLSHGVTVVDRTGATLVSGLGNDLGDVAGFAWDPRNDAVWIAANAAQFSSGLWRLGLDGSVRKAVSLPGPVTIEDVSRDGRVLLHTGFERQGIRARAPGEAIERELCPQVFCSSSLLTPDGRHVLFVGATPGKEAPILFVRPTGGGLPVRLGEGSPLAVSPDGLWVLSRRNPKLVLELVPMGPGSPKNLITEGLEEVGGGFFLDAGHALIAANEPGHPWRGYLIDLGGRKPIPVMPEGVLPVPDSASGGSVLGFRDRELAWYPLAGGEPRPVATRLPPDSFPLRASADRSSLFLRVSDVPAHVDRFEIATGRRVRWRTLPPDDAAGVVGVFSISVAPDGSAHAYSYVRFFQDLYLVDGVR